MQQLTENERNAFKQLKTSDIEARYVWIGEKLEQFIVPHSAERKAQRKLIGSIGYLPTLSMEALP